MKIDERCPITINDINPIKENKNNHTENNQILSISDFNIFNKNTFSIKKSIANILSKIIDYNRESKKYFISDLKATKFFNENRNLFNIY